MILHLAVLLAAGLYDLAYDDSGAERLIPYQRRGTVAASHIAFGHTVGIFTTRQGRWCTFEVIVDQPSGCVVHARGCGLREAPLCP